MRERGSKRRQRRGHVQHCGVRDPVVLADAWRADAQIGERSQPEDDRETALRYAERLISLRICRDDTSASTSADLGERYASFTAAWERHLILGVRNVECAAVVLIVGGLLGTGLAGCSGSAKIEAESPCRRRLKDDPLPTVEF